MLPFGDGHRWLTGGLLERASLGGWSVTGAGRYQNGFPVSVWQSSNNSGLLGSNQRPNIVAGVRPGDDGQHWRSGWRSWINPAAFAPAPAFTLGNAPRTIPGPAHAGSAQHRPGHPEIAAVSAAQTISLRADVLNLFDNPLFSGPVRPSARATFGQITAVGGFARSVQFQARLGW